MNKKKEISVVTPAFNSEHFIDSTIRSVVEQTFTDWEMLIIDDGSKDETCAIVQRWQDIDRRIRLIKNSQNIGPGPSRNRGVAEASGRYIAYLDSDDYWFPSKLEEQLKFMEKINSAISCTGYRVADERNKCIGELLPPARVNYTDLLKRCTAGCSTVIYNVDILGKRYFPECGHEDYALWLNILKENMELDGLKKKLSTYTKRRGSISSNKIKVLRYFLYIYYVREKFNILKSVFYTARYAWLNKNKYNLTPQK